MMNVHKQLGGAAATLTALMTALVLTACGGTDKQSPTSAGPPPPTTIPPPTTTSQTGAIPRVFFTNLTDGQQVGYLMVVEGTIIRLPPGLEVWAVVQPDQNPSYHPQVALRVGAGGQWRAVCNFGTRAVGSGQSYTLLIVSATRSADQEFRRYLAGASATGYRGMGSLPAGSQELSEIRVRRS
jgi:hypothetical protein